MASIARFTPLMVGPAVIGAIGLHGGQDRKSLSRPVAMTIKDCVNRAYESALAEGLLFEHRALHAAFSLHDQKEGMRAFAEKRRQIHQFPG